MAVETDRRIAVRYKESGASRSIPLEKFDPAIHERVKARGSWLCDSCHELVRPGEPVRPEGDSYVHARCATDESEER